MRTLFCSNFRIGEWKMVWSEWVEATKLVVVGTRTVVTYVTWRGKLVRDDLDSR